MTKFHLTWLSLILQERFGFEFTLEQITKGLVLRLTDTEGTILFDYLEESFFKSTSYTPYADWDGMAEGWQSALNTPIPMPGATKLQSPLIEQNNDGYVIHYDILGLTYWMLSRQEEVGRTDLDSHGRFPASSSHAFKYGYLDRPVVDEWLDILGQVILRQWPQLELKKHPPRTLASCDVDIPYLGHSKTLIATLRRVLGDLLKRKSPSKALGAMFHYINAQRDCYESDPFIGAINWIMEANEQVGNKVAFYFIPEQLHSVYDSFYHMDERVIRRLMKHINSRGHEIGLHTSYTTYQDSEQTEREARILRQVLHEENIGQLELGGRQHYLRWETPTTARNWESAGMTYDSTLGYADHPGFRCGTCHEYPMFDPVKGRVLALRQRPLVVMECSVIDERYLGLGYSEEAIALMKSHKEICYKVGGNFTLLWHNSHFTSEQDKKFYKELIS